MSGLAAEAPTSGARATTKVRIAGVVEKVRSLYFWLERNVALGVESVGEERKGSSPGRIRHGGRSAGEGESAEHRQTDRQTENNGCPK